MTKIVSVEQADVRFPTSRELRRLRRHEPRPRLLGGVRDRPRPTAATASTGHGLSFTIGRGNEIVVAAVGALRPLVVGQPIAAFTDAPGAFWKHLTGDSQLRWLGPEKGVIHLATAAVVNALWDLWAKLAGKPLWKLLSDMTPAQIVELVDWRYLTDALTPAEARRALERLVPTRAVREAELRETGYPAYTTSAGWLGYSDEKIRRLCREGLADGFTRFKIKVGLDPADDLRRATLVREEIGETGVLMIDANQRWDVGTAIEWVRGLAATRPLWIEEPTSPDDVLGHAAIARALEPLGIAVATGEHCANRVMFKQMLQARALAYCQIDFCRLAGVNEVVAVLLLAAHFGVPVCPHAGGVGLCEYVQHASIFDYIAVSGALQGRSSNTSTTCTSTSSIPAWSTAGATRSRARRSSPGTAPQLRPESIAAHLFPADGPVWRDR